MKRQFLLLLAIAVFSTALTTNASAQTAKTLRANVKFDFQIGDRIYPAGAYRIELISSDNILLITSASDTNKNPSTGVRSWFAVCHQDAGDDK